VKLPSTEPVGINLVGGLVERGEGSPLIYKHKHHTEDVFKFGLKLELKIGWISGSIMSTVNIKNATVLIHFNVAWQFPVYTSNKGPIFQCIQARNGSRLVLPGSHKPR
jgi:hypothetical protein